MLTTSVNNFWKETSWCGIVPHSVSPSLSVSPRARCATGSSYCSPCRRLDESGKDAHGAGDGLNSGEEHAGDGLVSHLRAGWLAGRSVQGAEYGPEFICDSKWWGDRPGTGGAGGSGGGGKETGGENPPTQNRGAAPPPGERCGARAMGRRE